MNKRSFSTKSPYKLYCLADFLKRYSKQDKEQIIWILRDSALYGIVIDPTNKILIKSKFSFDNVLEHKPLQFRLDGNQFLDKLSCVKRNNLVHFEFGEENLPVNLTLIREENENVVKSSIPIISSFDTLDDFVADFAYSSSFTMSTINFSKICSDLKSVAKIRLEQKNNLISFVGFNTEMNEKESIMFTANSGMGECNITMQPNILSAWRKTLLNISNELVFKISNECIVIEANGVGMFINFSHQLI